MTEFVIENKSKLNLDNIYDPRIKDQKEDSQVIWTTNSVELAKKGIVDGYKLKQNPFIPTVKDALLRRANIPFRGTEDEEWVFEKAMFDKEFYSEFISLKDGEHGWRGIKLRDYQKDLLKNYDTSKWNIILFPRQSGKTTTTVIEICHFCTFNFDKDCVVIAQSEKVVNEILQKIKEAFASLPFFLQPGFIKFTKNGFVLDNGCRLSIGVASESVVQGFSLDFVFIDEFAYISNSRVKKFWNNIYPTMINNTQSRMIIASTPNGRNLFWELWMGAINKTNRFKTNRIYWYDVPGRDESFKKDTIANVGIEGWEMGFECSFDTQLKSIFRTAIQKTLRQNQKEAEDNKTWSKENHWLGELFDIEFIKQDFIEYNIAEDYFMFGIDLGEGLGQDSTTIKIRKLFWNSELKRIDFKSIGVYRDNEISVEDFAENTGNLFKYFDKNKIKIVVDLTNYGAEYFAHINKLKLYDPNFYHLDNVIFAKFENNTKKDFEQGIRWNQQNKKLAVRSFTGLVNSKELDENHFLTVEEYLNFGKNANGSYSAQYGHDDLIMGDISIAWFLKSNNLFANEFLKAAEWDLRKLANDLNEEQKKEEAKIKRLQKSKFESNGFTLRNSEAEINNINRYNKNIRQNMHGSMQLDKYKQNDINQPGLINNNRSLTGRNNRRRNKDDDYFNSDFS